MRVILFVTDLQPGGTPMRIARLARGLHGAGLDVHAGCLAPAGPVSAELGNAGIPTFACDAAGPRDLAALRRLSRHVRRIRPRLIHSTLMHANVAARLMGLLHRLPVIGSTATIEVERPWHLRLERLTAHIDRMHVVNSRAIAGHVRRAFRLPARKIAIVPPSVEPVPGRPTRQAARAALNIPDHEFAVLWIGRIDPVKRLEIVVRCAEILSDVPSRFLIAGDGPARDDLERTVRISSAARRIHLLGWRGDAPRLMAAADAFVFPSLTEGMPNAVLEALAAGLPVVASSIAPLQELAEAGAPLALARGDEPIAFAEALRAFAAGPERRAEHSRRSVDWAAANLDPVRTVRAVIGIYRRVLGKRL